MLVGAREQATETLFFFLEQDTLEPDGDCNSSGDMTPRENTSGLAPPSSLSGPQKTFGCVPSLTANRLNLPHSSVKQQAHSSSSTATAFTPLLTPIAIELLLARSPSLVHFCFNSQ